MSGADAGLEKLKTVDRNVYNLANRLELTTSRDIFDVFVSRGKKTADRTDNTLKVLSAVGSHIYPIPKNASAALDPNQENGRELSSSQVRRKRGTTQANNVSAADLLSWQTHKLATGDPVIDRFLEGGVSCGMLTEIYGPSGTGKTQFALHMITQLMLQNKYNQENPRQRPVGAAYIYTNGSFRTDRLVEMVTESLGLDPEGSVYGSEPSDITKLTDHVHVVGVSDLDTQSHIINYSLEGLVMSRNVKLIVVDSFASHYRDSRSSSNEQQRMMYESANALKRLAYKYHVAVILVNQVTSNMKESVFIESESVAPYLNPMSSQPVSEWTEKNIPALGVSWSNLISTRISFGLTGMAHECNVVFDTSDETITRRRIMKVKLSPNLPQSSCQFYISKAGIVHE